MASWSTRLGAAVLAAAPVAGLLLLAAPVAEAHDVLVSTSPAEGTTVDAPPESVALTFDNAVQNKFAQVVVLGPDETPYQDGDPDVVGATVTQQVAGLPAGEITVSYRVVSSDGHPIEGTYTFTVAATTAEATTPDDGSTPTTPALPPTPSPLATEAVADGEPGTSTVILMIGGAAAVGAAVAFAVRARGRRSQVEDTDS